MNHTDSGALIAWLDGELPVGVVASWMRISAAVHPVSTSSIRCAQWRRNSMPPWP